ncbi:DUF309 domain-containing protein [Streptomyces sp. WMMB 322]|uniref:DUF309 domain-containing protein n=1 Tax=Streptomyces sp. WMMB 322 TaxID=1286821 RepID=UPI0006E247A9|nr:DUF309 domain-containing protein [Streptomyces sp. WMMB 322]SCK57721.1 hypothetical protein H180DRAFT_05447 [Streptomyces sp. WMMB 322]
MQESQEQQGGEAACWLNQVCEECGRVREDSSRPGCEHCGHDPRGTRTAASGRGSRRRDRDSEGKARNARPRDGLGRPLPHGEQGVPRAPEGVVRTPERTLEEAQRLLDDGMPFHAHEVLEDAWKSAPEAEAPLWKGLAQLAVGITHLARGNTKGGARLLLRGAEGIEPYGSSPPHGIDVAGLADWARATAEGAEETGRPDADGKAAGEPAAPGLRRQG